MIKDSISHESIFVDKKHIQLYSDKLFVQFQMFWILSMIKLEQLFFQELIE